MSSMITTQNSSNLSQYSVVLAYYNGNTVLKSVAPCNRSCLVELGEVTFDELEILVKYEMYGTLSINDLMQV